MLKRQPLGESDAILVTLSPEGRLDCVVQAGLKSRRWSALIEPPSLLECQFYRAKGLPYLREATLLSGFTSIREDLERLQIAGYWMALLQVVIQPDQDHTTLFRAAVWALKLLDQGAPRAALHFWLELRILANLGLSPRLGICVRCDHDQVCAWDPRAGGLICPTCAGEPSPPDTEHRIHPLGDLSIAVLRTLSHCPPAALPELDLPLQQTREIFTALRGHMFEQLPESIKTCQTHPEIGAQLLSPCES